MYPKSYMTLTLQARKHMSIRHPHYHEPYKNSIDEGIALIKYVQA
jgi:hypothetical protein